MYKENRLLLLLVLIAVIISIRCEKELYTLSDDDDTEVDTCLTNNAILEAIPDDDPFFGKFLTYVKYSDTCVPETDTELRTRIQGTLAIDPDSPCCCGSTEALDALQDGIDLFYDAIVGNATEPTRDLIRYDEDGVNLFLRICYAREQLGIISSTEATTTVLNSDVADYEPGSACKKAAIKFFDSHYLPDGNVEMNKNTARCAKFVVNWTRFLFHAACRGDYDNLFVSNSDTGKLELYVRHTILQMAEAECSDSINWWLNNWSKLANVVKSSREDWQREYLYKEEMKQTRGDDAIGIWGMLANRVHEFEDVSVSGDTNEDASGLYSYYWQDSGYTNPKTEVPIYEVTDEPECRLPQSKQWPAFLPSLNMAPGVISLVLRGGTLSPLKNGGTTCLYDIIKSGNNEPFIQFETSEDRPDVTKIIDSMSLGPSFNIDWSSAICSDPWSGCGDGIFARVFSSGFVQFTLVLIFVVLIVGGIIFLGIKTGKINSNTYIRIVDSISNAKDKFIGLFRRKKKYDKVSLHRF